MNIKNTSGHSVLIVVIAFVAVGILGLISWRIFDSNAGRKNDNNQQNKDSQPGQIETSPSQSSTYPNEGYVVIKEWNVRFKPVEGLSGVQYFKPSDVPGDVFTFTTEKLAQQAPGCAPASKSFALGSLRRSKQRGLPGQEFGPISEYYFYLLGPQAACSEQPNTLEGPALRMLLESIPTLEEAKQ